MRILSIPLFSTLLLTWGTIGAQHKTTNWKECIERFSEIEQLPYICESVELIGTWGCGDSIYWGAVAGKEDAIPFLLEKIADSSMTSASIPYFGAEYTVGEIAYSALGEIISGIPTFELVPVAFDKNGCGGCSFWKYLRASHANRIQFSESVKKWYKDHKEKLAWVKGGKPLTCDCWFSHPNNGYFVLGD